MLKFKSDTILENVYESDFNLGIRTIELFYESLFASELANTTMTYDFLISHKLIIRYKTLRKIEFSNNEKASLIKQKIEKQYDDYLENLILVYLLSKTQNLKILEKEINLKLSISERYSHLLEEEARNKEEKKIKEDLYFYTLF